MAEDDVSKPEEFAFVPQGQGGTFHHSIEFAREQDDQVYLRILTFESDVPYSRIYIPLKPVELGVIGRMAFDAKHHFSQAVSDGSDVESD